VTKLCVFCGSSNGNHPAYAELARQLGWWLGQHKITLIYGGGGIGLMGTLADSCLEKGGQVMGFIPQKLVEWETGHHGITQLTIVETMHERKQKMYENADGLLALPGGLGTLDELFEALTWAQLEYHRKPCWLLNHRSFYNHLIEHLKRTVAEGFLSAENLHLVRVTNTIEDFFIDFQKEFYGTV
jgi:uncharacterized protein (TIGR00730 family)